MEGNLLGFEERRAKQLARGSITPLKAPIASSNPYDPLTSPPTILQYLPPDGSKFGIFGDPFARQVYYMPKTGNHNAKYWLNNRIEEHSFSDREIKLIDFLSRHRCATISQIRNAIFSDITNPETVKMFVKKAHGRGVIAAFSWATPCQDGKKKPLVYGLTRVGAQAAEYLFHVKVHKDFQFQPVEMSPDIAPSMQPYLFNLVANELFSQLKKIDRILKWERSPHLPFDGQGYHRPQFSAELIKDYGEYKTIWVEVLRMNEKWNESLIERFQRTQTAYEKLAEHLKPSRVILIVDSDSRIPYIASLAEEYMPDVVLRYTTDERLVRGMNRTTFMQFDPVNKKIVSSPIPFLTEDAPGMKASEYLAQQKVDFDDEFEDM